MQCLHSSKIQIQNPSAKCRDNRSPEQLLHERQFFELAPYKAQFFANCRRFRDSRTTFTQSDTMTRSKGIHISPNCHAQRAVRDKLHTCYTLQLVRISLRCEKKKSSLLFVHLATQSFRWGDKQFIAHPQLIHSQFIDRLSKTIIQFHSVKPLIFFVKYQIALVRNSTVKLLPQSSFVLKNAKLVRNLQNDSIHRKENATMVFTTRAYRV